MPPLVSLDKELPVLYIDVQYGLISRLWSWACPRGFLGHRKTLPIVIFQPVSIDDVVKVIKQSPAKSCAFDAIPTHLLKESAVIESQNCKCLPFIRYCA
jgi:hypothetical protein